MYFTAEISGGYRELHRTDGTSIQRFADIRSGDSDDAAVLVVYGNQLYFNAHDGTSVNTYRTNGTQIEKALQNIEMRNPVVAGGYLHFSDGNHPMRTNGTTFERLTNVIGDPVRYENYGAGVAFVANGILYHWTPSELRQLSNLNSIEDLRAAGDTLYFEARNVSNESKLFSLNDNQLRQVSDLLDGGNDSIQDAIVFDGWLYFRANSPWNKQKFFKTDGETIAIAGNFKGRFLDDSSIDHEYASSLGYLFWRTQSEFNVDKLFATDGTATYQIANTRNDELASDGAGMPMEFKGALYFEARDSNNDFCLYRLQPN